MRCRPALDTALLAPDRAAGRVLFETAVSGAPEPDLHTQRFDGLLDAAIAAGNLEEVKRLETWLWLDGVQVPVMVACGELDVPFLIGRSREPLTRGTSCGLASLCGIADLVATLALAAWCSRC
jgi:hypothetical protein